MAKIAISDGAADFAKSLGTLNDPDWHEAEEMLGDGREKIRAAVQRATNAILPDAGRARAFEESLGIVTKALGNLKLPIESGELLLQTTILAIYAADKISEADYDTLVKPMQLAWATVPTWADLQQ